MNRPATIAAALLISGAAAAQDAPRAPLTVTRSYTITAKGKGAAQAQLVKLDKQIAAANAELDGASKVYRPESPEYREAKAKLEALLSQRSLALSDLAAANANVFFYPAAGTLRPDIRLDLDLDNATPREAFKQIFERAKLTGRVDDEVPDEPRITVRARGVRFSTALDLASQDLQLAVVREKDGAWRVRKADKLSPAVGALPGFSGLFPPGAKGGSIAIAPLPSDAAASLRSMTGTLSRYWLDEERSTFICPHCKGQVTVLRKRQQPKCPKCGRAFQDDWQFCPADGTKRPAVSGDWKFCPLCGHEVQMQRSGESIPILGDLPIIGELFRIPERPAPALPEQEPRKPGADPCSALPGLEHRSGNAGHTLFGGASTLDARRVLAPAFSSRWRSGARVAQSAAPTGLFN